MPSLLVLQGATSYTYPKGNSRDSHALHIILLTHNTPDHVLWYSIMSRDWDWDFHRAWQNWVPYENRTENNAVRLVCLKSEHKVIPANTLYQIRAKQVDMTKTPFQPSVVEISKFHLILLFY